MVGANHLGYKRGFLPLYLGLVVMVNKSFRIGVYESAMQTTDVSRWPAEPNVPSKALTRDPKKAVVRMRYV